MSGVLDDLSDLEIPGSADPVRHIDRPVPPWEDDPITMCGRRHGDVKVVVTRAAAVALVKKVNLQRAALFLCNGCLDRLRYRGKRWEVDPVEVTSWWLERHRYRDTARPDEVVATLVALGQLVENHREEFEALRSPDLVRLDSRRRQVRRFR